MPAVQIHHILILFMNAGDLSHILDLYSACELGLFAVAETDAAVGSVVDDTIGNGALRATDHEQVRSGRESVGGIYPMFLCSLYETRRGLALWGHFCENAAIT